MECCVIIVNGFRLSRGHISGHRCSILCINDLLFKNCLKHVHLKDLFIALFVLGSEHGLTRSITIWCSILCMNNRYLEKSAKKIAPSQKITPWKYDPRKNAPRKIVPPPPRTIAPWKIVLLSFCCFWHYHMVVPFETFLVASCRDVSRTPATTIIRLPLTTLTTIALPLSLSPSNIYNRSPVNYC